MTLKASLSGVASELRIDIADLWTTLLPLALWILRQVDPSSYAAPLRSGAPRAVAGARIIVGITGAGASGKTRMALVLRFLINALATLPPAMVGLADGSLPVEDAVAVDISMDGYHFLNSRLRASPAPAPTADAVAAELDVEDSLESVVSGPPSAMEALLVREAAAAAVSEAVDTALDRAQAVSVGSVDFFPDPLTSTPLAGPTLMDVKGSLSTIDAACFASDVLHLRGAAASTSELSPFLAPAYDRNTHDPAPASIPVLPSHRIVLVEGLYLLHGASSRLSAAPALPPPGSAASPSKAGTPVPRHSPSHLQRLWCLVHSAMDAVVFLDVPKNVCRERMVARKVRGGRSQASSNAHFDVVDGPVFDAISLQWRAADAVLRFGNDDALETLGIRGAVRGCDFAFAAASSSAAAVSVSAGSSRRARHPRAPTPASIDLPARVRPRASAASSSSGLGLPVHLVFLGLNPALQRAIVMPASRDVGCAGRAAGPWTKGGVQRATQVVVGVGGKGQNAAAASVLLPAATTASVVQPVAGREGDAFLDAQSEASGSAVRPLTWRVRDPAARTRCCLTLVDASGLCSADEAVTEIIEPGFALCPGDVAGLSDLIAQAIGTPRFTKGHVDDAPDAGAREAKVQGRFHHTDGDDEGVDEGTGEGAGEGEEEDPVVPVSAVAMMGTVPAGCEDLYRDAARLAAALRSPSGRTLGGLTDGSPLVLLDGYKGEGVLRVLRAGLVHVLKVNADELVELAQHAACGARVHPAGLPATHSRRFEAVEAAAMAVHRGFGVRLVAITDGAKAAFLFDFRATAATTISLHGAGTFDEQASPLRGSLGVPLAPSPQAARRRPTAVLSRLAAKHGVSVTASPAAASTANPEDASFSGRGGCLFAAHAFRVPTIPYQPDLRALQSPIGAGDACAGVFLHCLVRGVAPAAAFAHGLAAASASCRSLHCAKFDVADLAANVLPKVVIETWKEASVAPG